MRADRSFFAASARHQGGVYHNKTRGLAAGPISMIIGTRTSDPTQTVELTDDAIERHIHVVGVSGGGKSTLLEHMALAVITEKLRDWDGGYGLCFLDPHGESVKAVADNIPQHLTEKVIYWEPFNLECKFGYNPLALKDTSEKSKSLTTKRVCAAIQHVFESYDPNGSEFYRQLERKILRHTVRLLMDNNRTLLDIQACLLNHEWREALLAQCTSKHTTNFWTLEYDVWNGKQKVEYTASLLNKADDFLSDPVMENVLSRNTLDIRELMDTGGILLVNLSRGEMGEEASGLLGSLLTAGLVGAALSRADTPEKLRRPFLLLADEFAPFANRAFETGLSQVRKYKLHLVLGHQYLAQLQRYVADAIMGNCSTTIAFRCGEDADRLATHLTLKQSDSLRDLPNYRAYVRTLQNKAPTDRIDMSTFPPAEPGGRLVAIQKMMKGRYGA